MLEEIQEITEKYEVLEKMAQGGMGAIYRVRHRILDEIRVIKTILPDQTANDDSRARFLREARVAAQLRHPNIATLYDCSITEDGTAYMVIEFIDGLNLYQFLQSGFSFSPSEVQTLGAQVLEALDYLHDRGVIHRDVSTDNLMLTEDSKGQRHVKLIDLGLAKSLAHTDFKTKTGVLVGKVTYISPEQLSADEAVLDARCDLYSFGIVLYELLTGQIPIVGQDQMSLMAGHLYHAPKSFEVTDPKGLIPPALRRVVLKALEKNPDERYQSAQEFKTALLTEAPPPPIGLSSPPQATEILPAPTRAPSTGAASNQHPLGRRLATLVGHRWLFPAILLVALSLAAWVAVKGLGGLGSTAGSGSQLPLYATKYALVIGNNEYQLAPKLETAVNDANGIAEILENRYGFTVIKLINATRDDLFDALQRLDDEVKARDSLLVYYAGHGDRVQGSEYWMFVDADPADPTNWVSTQQEVTQRIDAMPAKHVLVIADSCFAGVAESGNTLEPPTDALDLVQRNSRLVLASGSDEPVLDSARGPNSIFASSLIRVLRAGKGPLEISQVFDDVARQVEAKALEKGASQIPSLAPLPNTRDSGGGFFFIPPVQESG